MTDLEGVSEQLLTAVTANRPSFSNNVKVYVYRYMYMCVWVGVCVCGSICKWRDRENKRKKNCEGIWHMESNRIERE